VGGWVTGSQHGREYVVTLHTSYRPLTNTLAAMPTRLTQKAAAHPWQKLA
jgi:hypothetical protein